MANDDAVEGRLDVKEVDGVFKLYLEDGTPIDVVGLTGLAVSGTAGVGNGSSANVTALAKGTGVGPTSDVVNKWLPVTINGDTGWIPFFK